MKSKLDLAKYNLDLGKYKLGKVVCSKHLEGFMLGRRGFGIRAMKVLL